MMMTMMIIASVVLFLYMESVVVQRINKENDNDTKKFLWLLYFFFHCKFRLKNLD